MNIVTKLKPRIKEHHLLLINHFATFKPVPLGELAKMLGLSVKVSTLEFGLSGLIQATDKEYQIKINRFERRGRQRFTLAHEISHFLLHRDIIDEFGVIKDTVLYRSVHSADVELEACKLASELILPSKRFKQDMDKYDGVLTDEEVEGLTEEWEVLKRIINIKMKEILKE